MSEIDTLKAMINLTKKNISRGERSSRYYDRIESKLKFKQQKLL